VQGKYSIGKRARQRWADKQAHNKYGHLPLVHTLAHAEAQSGPSTSHLTARGHALAVQASPLCDQERAYAVLYEDARISSRLG